MAELVNVKHVTPDQPNTSQNECPSDGSTTGKTEASSTSSGAVKHAREVCTDMPVRGDFLDKEANRRRLAWPGAISPGDDAFAGEKQAYVVKAIRSYKKRLLYKNAFFLSVAVLLAQTAVYGAADLRAAGLQSAAATEWQIAESSVYHVVVILGLLFATPCLAAKLGAKLALVVGLSFYFVYALFHGYVRPSTMILGRVLAALGAGLLWTALGCYLAKVALFLRVVSGASEEGTVYVVFGCFYLIYHIAGIWNTLMTAYILHSDAYRTTITEPSINHVMCGAFYCPAQDVNNTSQDFGTTDTTKRYIFYGVSIILCLMSILVVILCVSKLNWQPKEDNDGYQREMIEAEEKIIGETSPRKIDCSQLWISSSFYQMANRQQLYLIPLTLYSGLQESFYMHQFNQSYVACSHGYRIVVLTTVVNAAVASLSSIVIAQVARKTGRIAPFVVAALAHSASLLAMFLWHPNADMFFVPLIISAVWAVGHAVWQCLLHGFYGVLFLWKNPEGAFANHHLWKNVGSMAAVLCSYYICNYVTIFTLLSVLTTGMLGYFAVEVPLYRKARR